MILAAQHIRERCTPGHSTIFRATPLISPFFERTVSMGFTFGLSSCGYDIRVAQKVVLRAGGFCLASSMERFDLPLDLRMTIRDKSSWARRGLAVQNTVAEPGWYGFLTLELTNHQESRYTSKENQYSKTLIIEPGTPIAQVDFELLSAPTDQPYMGRYQDQPPGPQQAIVAQEGDR